MKHMQLRLFILSLSGILSLAHAAPMNQTGYFIGLGGSYNRLQVNANSSATLNALTGVPPNGIFSGEIGSYDHSQLTFSPEVQIGYFQHFSCTPWLWGLELLYQDTQTTVKQSDVSVNLINPELNVTNQLTINSIKTRVKDTFILPLFIGYSFQNHFAYLGAGPAVFNTQLSMHDLHDTRSAYYIGNINSFSHAKWIWGGAIQAGIAYYLNPAWFLNLNYTYAFTGHYSMNKTVPFSRSNDGGLNNGNLTVNTNQKLNTQGVAVSINVVM